MTGECEEYLAPTQLCDFDRHPEIRAKASELTAGCHDSDEMFQHIFSFIKELPYGLEDWDVPASETLAKGWGMCSGKTNLLAALLRSVGIPVRYRVFRIKAEARLWQWITEDEELARLMDGAGTEQDHIDCEVWLGEWRPYDPSRDTPLEHGLSALGTPIERQATTDASGRVLRLTLASVDQWAKERQERRRFRDDRREIFARVNEHLWRIRALGQGEGTGKHPKTADPANNA